MERNVTIPGGSSEGGGISTRNSESIQSSRTTSPRGNSTQATATRSSLSSSRVSSPIGQNRGSEEKINLSASTNAINASISSNGRSENRVHFDLKNSDMIKNQSSLNATRKTANLTSAASTVRRLTTSQPNHLSALPLDARQRLEEMVNSIFINVNGTVLVKFLSLKCITFILI